MHPTGLLNLRAQNKLSFKHVMEHVVRIPHKCHNFFFVTLVSLKVSSGSFSHEFFRAFWEWCLPVLPVRCRHCVGRLSGGGGRDRAGHRHRHDLRRRHPQGRLRQGANGANLSHRYEKKIRQIEVLPNQQRRWYGGMESQLESMHVFALWAPTCMLSWCLINKNFLELSRKFIKSALLVG